MLCQFRTSNKSLLKSKYIARIIKKDFYVMVTQLAEPKLCSQSSSQNCNAHGFSAPRSWLSPRICCRWKQATLERIWKPPLDHKVDEQYLCSNEVRKQYFYVTLNLVNRYYAKPSLLLFQRVQPAADLSNYGENLYLLVLKYGTKARVLEFECLMNLHLDFLCSANCP